MAPEGGYQGRSWSELRNATEHPPPPGRWLRWLAEHRLRVRAILLGLDVVLISVAIWAIATGEFRWWWLLQWMTFGWLTSLYGWVLPRQVDAWDARWGGTAD